jgi:hypothetical protein
MLSLLLPELGTCHHLAAERVLVVVMAEVTRDQLVQTLRNLVGHVPGQSRQAVDGGGDNNFMPTVEILGEDRRRRAEGAAEGSMADTAASSVPAPKRPRFNPPARTGLLRREPEKSAADEDGPSKDEEEEVEAFVEKEVVEEEVVEEEVEADVGDEDPAGNVKEEVEAGPQVLHVLFIEAACISLTKNDWIGLVPGKLYRCWFGSSVQCTHTSIPRPSSSTVQKRTAPSLLLRSPASADTRVECTAPGKFCHAIRSLWAQ